MTRISSFFLSVVVSCVVSAVHLSAQEISLLSETQKRELTYFAISSMGLTNSIDDVKQIPEDSELATLVATGLNFHGLLCASVEGVRELQLRSRYEVTCIEYRGGSATKTYIVDSINATAFEQ